MNASTFTPAPDAAAEECEQSPQQVGRRRWAAANHEVDWNHLRDRAHTRIAVREHPTPGAAVSDRNHPLRRRRCGVGALEGLAHVERDRAGHEQQVGMARGGHEADTEALDIVKGVAERVDFEFAAVAGARIDFADRETAPEGSRDDASKLGARELRASPSLRSRARCMVR